MENKDISLKKRGVSDTLKETYKNQRQRNKVSVYIFVGLFVVVFSLAVLLPDDVLSKYSILGELIKFVEELIPSVKKFGEVSKFPQVAQLVFVLQIFIIPILIMLNMRTIGNPKITKLSQFLLVFFVVLGMAYGYFFYIPGDGVGYGFSTKISSSMISSKLFFAFWTSVFTFSFSVFLSGTVKVFLSK